MKKNKKITIGLIFIIPFLMGIGIDLYVPSLPIIAKYFNVQKGYVQWSIGLYMLGYGVGQIVLGTISDYIGRKKIILCCSIVFSLGSIVVAFTDNIWVFNIIRLIQGLSVAGLAVVVRAIMVDIFDRTEIKKVSNYFTLSWSLGPIVAPFIGANLEKLFSWKANFYFFSAYGALTFLYIFFLLTESNLISNDIDIKKIYLDSIEMIKCRSFTFIIIMSALGYSSIVVFNTIGPFIIERIFHKSISFYGYTAMFLGTAYFIGAIINRFLIIKFEEKNLITIGSVSSFIISIFMIYLNFNYNNFIVLIIPLYLIFLLIGLIVPNSVSMSMNLFKNRSGLVSSLFGTITGIVVFIVSNVVGIINISSGFAVGVIYMVVMFLILVSNKISNY